MGQEAIYEVEDEIWFFNKDITNTKVFDKIDKTLVRDQKGSDLSWGKERPDYTDHERLADHTKLVKLAKHVRGQRASIEVKVWED